MAVSLETLASYVPAWVVRHLAHAPGPITAPWGARLSAAVFSADISGFSTLTNQLVQDGPQGVEGLSIILNAYFGQLIDLVTDHGGDIIEFTGDGILAIWSTDSYGQGEDLATAVYRAAQCGLTAQHILNGYEFTSGITMSLRIGIGAGKILLATVGGMLGRWELLMAGEPLPQVSIAQDMAKPGEVVLSPEAWARVQNWCIGCPVTNEHPAPVNVSGMSEQNGTTAQSIAVAAGGNTPQTHPHTYADHSQVGFRLDNARRYLEPQPLPDYDLTPPMADALRAYLPAALLARLDAGQSDWIAELRRLTVLFINVTGIGYDTPDIVQQLQTHMQELQATLYHYEGSLNQFIVDDKGTLLIAAMGLPPLTHEDDAVRGVRLALDMHERLRQRNLGGSIGVATGRVFCGVRGNTRRRDYAIIGDVMNMAARLMQAAEGDILTDEATYQAAHTVLTFEPLPARALKGHAQPVQVYRPYNTLTADMCLQSRIVGRTRERTFLVAQLEALARDRSGSVVVIEGEAGMGKSRLVDYLLQQAQTFRVTSLVGKGDAIEQSTPYHIWQAIFWQLFQLDNVPDNPVAYRMHVLDMLHEEPEIMRLAPLLNSVLPLAIPPNDITSHMDGYVRADNTRALLLRVLQYMTERRALLIVLEDANWMDSASWALTMAVSQHLHSLMLVIITRPMTDPMASISLLKGSLEFELSQSSASILQPDPAPPVPDMCPFPFQAGKHHSRGQEAVEYGHLLKRPHAYRITLNGLSKSETEMLVRQCLGATSVPERVVALIYQKAQGNPFFTQELACALRDRQVVVVDQDNHDNHGMGTARIAPDVEDIHTINFPDTVQGVIISRIDRLTQAQQLILKVASVIGDIFPFRILYDIYPIDEDKAQLAHQLHIFEQLDLVTLRSHEPELTYQFQHIITRDVVYDTLLFSQRRDMHRAVAQWYETHYADDLARFYELLAHHWDQAGVVAKSIEYAEKAGDQALQNFANHEAVRFFRHALALAEQQPDTTAFWRAHLEQRLGEAYVGLGNVAQIRQHLEESVALIGRPVPTNRTVLAARIGKQVVRQFWHRISPRRLTNYSAEARQALQLAAHTYGLLINIYYLSNETFLCVYASLNCLNLAERASGYSKWLVYAYANMCMTSGSLLLHSLARMYGCRSLDVAWRIGELPALAYALNLNALYRVGLGEWRQARSALDLAVRIGERLGDWTTWGVNWTLLAQCTYYQGDFTRSYAMFDHLATQSEHQGNRLHTAWALGGKGQNALRLGRLDEACRLLDEATSRLAENAEVPSQISNYGLLAMARLRQGNHEQAWQAATTAAHMIANTPLPGVYYLIEGYAGVAEVYLALCAFGEQHAARGGTAGSVGIVQLRQAEQACHEMSSFARLFPIAQPRAWLWKGSYAWATGRPFQAVRAWLKSLTRARQLSMPYEQALAHYEIGRYSSGAARSYHLEQACGLFEHLGSAYDLQQARGALAHMRQL
jgi:class 3 adenylate cyclase/tetratricopeptide (TPR) repeat protein